MDTNKAEKLAMQVLGDAAGAFTAALGYLGDKLGLFRTLSEMGSASSAQLATALHLNERYVREWLRGMTAAEYIEYRPESDEFYMTEEQSVVLATDASPLSMGGALQFTTPSIIHSPRLAQAFRDGGGIPYSEIGCEVHRAIERTYAPGYQHFLVDVWIASVPGLTQRLESGACVLDVGCGRGQSTLRMAKAFPRSRFLGIDPHHASIEAACSLAAEQQLSNVEFRTAFAEGEKDGARYDLVCTFDCIHDMVDPESALRAIRSSLKQDGVYLWAEPAGSHNPLENRNPVGKLSQTLSLFHCMTVSLAQGGAGLGTLIGEQGARELAERAGFSKFEKVGNRGLAESVLLTEGVRQKRSEPTW